MTLKRKDKETFVTDLAAELRASPSVVAASFQALPMADSAVLRSALKLRGGSLRVVPKRLFARVVSSLQWPGHLAETPYSVMVAWSADLFAPAQVLHRYVQAHQSVRLLGGILDQVPLAGEEVARVAQLPPRDVLRAQLVGTLAAPLHGLLGLCHAVLYGLPAVLSAQALRGEVTSSV